ncbi:MAG: hypothetical protein J7577_11485 [Sphingobacteriaceae bacterium]|nr:hypothetical protein [Sphingobacteriaceae bacterium]
MAFKAGLNFSGKKYKVLQHAYALNRDICGNICFQIHVYNTNIRFDENPG